MRCLPASATEELKAMIYKIIFGALSGTSAFLAEGISKKCFETGVLCSILTGEKKGQEALGSVPKAAEDRCFIGASAGRNIWKTINR